jgi:hypothetical protein
MSLSSMRTPQSVTTTIGPTIGPMSFHLRNMSALGKHRYDDGEHVHQHFFMEGTAAPMARPLRRKAATTIHGRPNHVACRDQDGRKQHRDVEMYGTGGRGQETKMLEMTYTRKP